MTIKVFLFEFFIGHSFAQGLFDLALQITVKEFKAGYVQVFQVSCAVSGFFPAFQQSHEQGVVHPEIWTIC